METASKAIVLGWLLLSQAVAGPSTFTDFDGTPRELSEALYPGAWTVVMLWHSECHVCNEEVGELIRFHAANQPGAGMLGVALDGYAGRAGAQHFIERHAVNFPNLLADELATAKFYAELTGERWIGTPTFLLYDPAGKLVAKQVGAVTQALLEDFIAQQPAR